MRMTIHLNNEAKYSLIEGGFNFSEVNDKEDGHLVVTLRLEDDDELLIDSLAHDELLEFFGIEPEFVIFVEVD